MASLQARHARACALGRPWTTVDATDGCSCPGGPLYHVVVREGAKAHRTAVGRNRRQAQKALTAIQGRVDEHAFRPVANIAFDTWADRWLAALERKEGTVNSYASTVAYAKMAFGARPVRRLRPEDVVRFGELLREQKLSASTRAKHLRVLGACLNSAVAHGYASKNPVSELPKAERPRPERKESAYFTNEEIPRLFAGDGEKSSPGADFPPTVYRALFLVALKTGMRLGELLALTWGDVDLAEGVIRVRRTYTDGKLGPPKNHERRDVDVTADVVELLGAWWGEQGRPGDQALVFGSYLVNSTVLRVLYAAMEAAGVPRVGPTGEKRTFHSFRHTYAKRALESGRSITWLSRHLGHSSVQVTTGVYGHFERAERKREAELMAGVFGV